MLPIHEIAIWIYFNWWLHIDVYEASLYSQGSWESRPSKALPDNKSNRQSAQYADKQWRQVTVYILLHFLQQLHFGSTLQKVKLHYQNLGMNKS